MKIGFILLCLQIDVIILIGLLQKLEYIFTDLDVYCIALHSRMDGDFEEKRIFI